MIGMVPAEEAFVATETGVKTAKVAPEQQAEIDLFKENIKGLLANQMDPELFKKFRLENGIYGIRGQVNVHMIRVKIPWGGLNADQLEALAEAGEKYSDGTAHVTTRQDIQYHWI